MKFRLSCYVVFIVVFYLMAGSAGFGAETDGKPVVSRQGRALTFWYDQAAFEAAVPGLTVEDWSGTNVNPGASQVDLGPFDSTTDNECFSPGAITAGISVRGVDDPTLQVYGVNADGNSTVRLGPGSLINDYRIDFHRSANAFGTRIFTVLNPGSTLHIDVYNTAGAIIDSDTITDLSWDDPGTFWGVTPDEFSRQIANASTPLVRSFFNFLNASSEFTGIKIFPFESVRSSISIETEYRGWGFWISSLKSSGRS